MITVRLTIDWTFDENRAVSVSKDSIDDAVEYTVRSLLDVAEHYGIEGTAEAIRNTSDAVQC